MAKIKVNVTLDEDLLRRIDDYAEDNYLNRSSFLTLSSTQFLGVAEATAAIKQISLCMRKIADSGKIDDDTKRQLEDLECFSKLLGGK